MDLETIVDHIGETRKLGYVPPDPSKQVLRNARTNIQTLRTQAGLSALIPQQEWTEVDYVKNAPPELINNQGQEGACVGASGCGGSQRQRWVRTGKVIQLSWPFLYDQINGGRDNGANIIDSMQVMEQVGVPELPLYPKSLFRANQVPASATMYHEDVAVTLTDALDCVTAILMGMFPQVPIYVNSSFEQWTSDGVAWGGRAPKGNASNHSIYLAGLKQIGTTWFFLMVNSWGLNWGPFKNGTCLLPFAGIDNPSMADDGYCHASTLNPALPMPGAAP